MPAPHWIESGGGTRGLLFLHGVSGGAEAARTLLPQLLPQGWRGLAWDMPGYGASAPLDPLDFDTLADAVVALLDAANLSRAVLVGHSLGGMIALHTAARHPTRVDALVLACCTPAFGAPAGPLQQAFLARRLGPLETGATMAELAADLIPAMAGPDADPALIGAHIALMTRIPPARYAAALRALVHFDARAALPGLTMPALAVAGQHDSVSTPRVVRQMAERLPAATYTELPAGHLAPFEAPEAFARLVRDFLTRLPDRPA